MEAFAAASRATIGTSHSIVVARQVLNEAAVAEIESIVPNPIPSFVQTVKPRSARRCWVANTAGHGARDSIAVAFCRWDYGADASANGSVASDTHDVSNGLSDPLGGGLDVAVPEMSVAERHADVGMAEEPRDHWHRHSIHHRVAGVGVSEFAVDASTAMAEPACRVEPYQGRRERRRDRDQPAGPVEERSGLVKFYNAAKGYGFVVPDGGGPHVFVPGSMLDHAGLVVLETGQRVSVMVEQGAHGLQARDIKLI